MILSVDFGRKRTGTSILDYEIEISSLNKPIEESNIDTVVFKIPYPTKAW